MQLVQSELATTSMREHFPIFTHHPELVYLDSAASAQKPQHVLTTLNDFYQSGYANIHRGVYGLSAMATERFEKARGAVARFIGASSPDEIVFTHGATESLNLIAQSYGRSVLGPGDEILLTVLEHHANIVPWQMIAAQTGARVLFAPITNDGLLNEDRWLSMLSERTKIVALTQLSNAIGVMPALDRLIPAARLVGATVVVDGSQGVCHLPTNVRTLDADFYVFSGHKLYGPTGIGVLYGRRSVLSTMPPFMGGGDMIRTVTVEGTEFADAPSRFEAGTPHIAGAIGLHAAIEFIEAVGRDDVLVHEHQLMEELEATLTEIPGVQLVGPQGRHAGSLSFVLEGVHPHDVSQFLAGCAIAVRAGHHCAEPLMKALELPATTRASVGMYNTREDIDRLARTIHQARQFFIR